MGFVQVRLEVVAININNIAAVVRAGKYRQTLVLNIYLYLKAGQRLRAEGILMPHLHKALSLPASGADRLLIGICLTPFLYN